jgi:hypothetical protein
MPIKVRTRLQRILNLVPVLDFLTLTDLASFLWNGGGQRVEEENVSKWLTQGERERRLFG